MLLSKMIGSRFKVQGSGFRVQGSGFRVQGSGFRVFTSEGGSGFPAATIEAKSLSHML